MKKKYLSPESAETPLVFETMLAASIEVGPGDSGDQMSVHKDIWNREGWLDKSSANE